MAYNKVSKLREMPVRPLNQGGWRPPDSGMEYRIADEQKKYGLNESHRYSEETRTEPITTKVQKLHGKLDHFERSTSSQRPIKTTGGKH